MSNDFDEYLRYKRPPGFQFEFPAGKKFAWTRKGEKRERTYEIAEVLDESDPKNTLIRVRDQTEVFFHKFPHWHSLLPHWSSWSLAPSPIPSPAPTVPDSPFCPIDPLLLSKVFI